MFIKIFGTCNAVGFYVLGILGMRGVMASGLECISGEAIGFALIIASTFLLVITWR